MIFGGFNQVNNFYQLILKQKTMSKIDSDILAKKVYDTYCKAVGGKAFNGDPLPHSSEFFNDPTKERQANAWRKALDEPYVLLLTTTQNLGHPAYNVSSSTTIAIDELRDKAFDYLEIPKK